MEESQKKPSHVSREEHNELVKRVNFLTVALQQMSKNQAMMNQLIKSWPFVIVKDDDSNNLK